MQLSSFSQRAYVRLIQSSGVVAGVVAGVGHAFAQGSPLPTRPTELPGTFSTVSTSINTIFNLVFAIAGAVFVILLLVGGIQYLTAAGNEEATAKARRLLVDSIVGLIIVLAAFAIGRFILGRFQLTTTPGE